MNRNSRIFRTLGCILLVLMAGATVFAQARYRSDTIAYYRDTVSGMHGGGPGLVSSAAFRDGSPRGFGLGYSDAAEGFVYVAAEQSFEGTCIIACHTGGAGGFWDTITITHPGMEASQPLPVVVTIVLVGSSEAPAGDSFRYNFAAAGLREADALPPGKGSCGRPFSDACEDYPFNPVRDARVAHPERRGEFVALETSPVFRIRNGQPVAFFVWGIRTWAGDGLSPRDLFSSYMFAWALIEAADGSPLQIRSAARGEIDPLN